MFSEVPSSFESFVALITLIGPFSCMGSDMDFQAVILHESLLATFIRTYEWPFSGLLWGGFFKMGGKIHELAREF